MSDAHLHQLDRSVVASDQSNGPTWTFTTNGADPFLAWKLPTAPPSSRDWMLSLEYFCPQGIPNVELRVGGPPTPVTPTATAPMAAAEGWTSWTVNLSKLTPSAVSATAPTRLRVDLGTRRKLRIQVRNVQLRPQSARELEAIEQAESRKRAKTSLARSIDAYHALSNENRLTSVDTSNGSVVVKGNVQPDTNTESLRIVTRAPHDIAALLPNPAHGEQWQLAGVDESGKFEMQLPEHPHPPGTRWQLIKQVSPVESPPTWKLASTARYADQFHRSRERHLPTPKPLRAAKGLTCLESRLSVEQIRELGLEHGSVNISLIDLVSAEPRRGFESVEIRGRKWWHNANRLAGLDARVRLITSAGVQLAGILLIPNRTKSDSPLIHPEANSSGTYAMPNLTTPESVDLYIATLDLLADRYARLDNRNGRIDHWIVHNEVDYGWQWTNMGEQPFAVFMDHYTRSMRLADACMRSVNPHARVFISLTHRWNVPDDQPWRTYAPRSMLHHLIRSCQLEGDFPWGIAYHPYPENLWKSDTWNDKRVTDNQDTPLITLKNLTVLDTFVHADLARQADGSIRPVICSEQGFHAPAEDEQALQRQCAALLYAWQQLRKCPSILAFDYHRPVDHPAEGGLRLGLRNLPSKEAPIGHPKPAWEVYRKINTTEEGK